MHRIINSRYTVLFFYGTAWWLYCNFCQIAITFVLWPEMWNLFLCYHKYIFWKFIDSFIPMSLYNILIHKFVWYKEFLQNMPCSFINNWKLFLSHKSEEKVFYFHVSQLINNNNILFFFVTKLSVRKLSSVLGPKSCNILTRSPGSLQTMTPAPPLQPPPTDNSVALLIGAALSLILVTILTTLCVSLVVICKKKTRPRRDTDQR